MKNFFEIDNRLTDLEVAWNKTALICDNVIEDYFSETEPEDGFLKTHYNESEIKMEILLDYLHMMKESIETVRKLLDEEFEMKKENAA